MSYRIGYRGVFGFSPKLGVGTQLGKPSVSEQVLVLRDLLAWIATRRHSVAPCKKTHPVDHNAIWGSVERKTTLNP